MEMIKVWAFFFEGERLSQLVLTVFFSDKTIRNCNPTVVQMTCLNINRICTKYFKDLHKNIDFLQKIVENSI